MASSDEQRASSMDSAVSTQFQHESSISLATAASSLRIATLPAASEAPFASRGSGAVSACSARVRKTRHSTARAAAYSYEIDVPSESE